MGLLNVFLIAVFSGVASAGFWEFNLQSQKCYRTIAGAELRICENLNEMLNCLDTAANLENLGKSKEAIDVTEGYERLCKDGSEEKRLYDSQIGCLASSLRDHLADYVSCVRDLPVYTNRDTIEKGCRFVDEIQKCLLKPVEHCGEEGLKLYHLLNDPSLRLGKKACQEKNGVGMTNANMYVSVFSAIMALAFIKWLSH